MPSSSTYVYPLLLLPKTSTKACLVQEYVVPNNVSIDGKNIPPLFAKAFLPWILQSPLMPNIAILMALYSQRYDHGINISLSQTLSIRSHVLGLVNGFLAQDFSKISDGAVRVVSHLVVLEVYRYLPCITLELMITSMLVVVGHRSLPLGSYVWPQGNNSPSRWH